MEKSYLLIALSFDHGLVLICYRCLTICGLHRRHRWPRLGSFYTAQPSNNGTLPLAKPLETASDLKRKVTDQSLLTETTNTQSGPGVLEYPVAGQVQEEENATSESTTMFIDSPIGKPLTAGSASLDPTRVALLLETRPSSHLPAVLSHFISVLPMGWTFRFVGSQASNALVSASASLREFIRSRKLIITELPSKYTIDDAESLSATLTDITFYRDFLAPAEWLFLFQTDSIVCSASTTSLDDWVDKDFTWLGAPWHINSSYGGNGGLSLRHLPPIIKLLQGEQRVANDLWEDRWLTDRLGTMEGAHMAGAEISRFFSVESVWTEKPFGYHLRSSGSFEHLDQGIWGDELRKNMILEYCPEVKLILDMDLSVDMQEQRHLGELATGKSNVEGQGGNETDVLKSEVVTLS